MCSAHSRNKSLFFGIGSWAIFWHTKTLFFKLLKRAQQNKKTKRKQENKNVHFRNPSTRRQNII